MTINKLTAVDANSLPWEERFNERIGRALFRKNLFIDPETGMEIRWCDIRLASSTPRTRTLAATACTCWKNVGHARRHFRSRLVHLVSRRRSDGTRRERCGRRDRRVHHEQAVPHRLRGREMNWTQVPTTRITTATD